MNKKVSKMGYRDDSPYRNRGSIDIHTPNGVIDMSNTGIPIIANGVYLSPYSGEYQFDTDIVREVPVRQYGGFSNPKEVYDYLFSDDEEEKAPITAPSATEAEPEENQSQAKPTVDFEEESIERLRPVRNAYRERRQHETQISASDGLPASAKGQYAFEYLVAKGIPKHVAAGMVGNFAQESGNFRDDVISGKTKGDSGLATGIAQWHSDRWRQAIAFNQAQGTSPYTLEGQLDFAVHEANSRGDLARTSKATNSEEAANIFAKYYERPKIIDTNRAKYAKAYYNLGGIYNELFKTEQ